MTLVLDRSDGSLGCPVNLVGKAHSRSLLTSALRSDGVSGEFDEVFGTELIRVHISKLVHLNAVGLKSSFVLSIVGLNKGKVGEPDGESVCLLLLGVPLIELGLPSSELMVLSRALPVEGVDADGSHCQ